LTRQHQQNSATSKSQCYVHNLKETEVNKGSSQTSRHNLGICSKDNQSLKPPQVSATRLDEQEKESTRNTNVENENISCNSQKKDDVNIGTKNDKLNANNPSIDKKDSKNLSVCGKKGSVFALLDEYFCSANQKSIESYVRVWMAEIILGLAHLHSNGIICRLVCPITI
jgi:hypothetical protein